MLIVNSRSYCGKMTISCINHITMNLNVCVTFGGILQKVQWNAKDRKENNAKDSLTLLSNWASNRLAVASRSLAYSVTSLAASNALRKAS